MSEAPQPDVDNVQPLVASHFQRGDYLNYMFRCPDSGRQIQSDPVHAADFIAEYRLHENKRKNKLLYMLKIELQQSMRNLFGATEEGTNAVKEVERVISEMDDGSLRFTEEEVAAGAVVAFIKEKRNFVWNPKGFFEHKDAEYERTK